MAKRPRLLAWYRVLPMLAVAVVGGVSAAYSYAPSLLVSAIFPLKYEEQIAQSASAHGVDPYLVAAVIETESGWDPDAKSGQGARGLMQLMPETAQDMVNKGLPSRRRRPTLSASTTRTIAIVSSIRTRSCRRPASPHVNLPAHRGALARIRCAVLRYMAKWL